MAAPPSTEGVPGSVPTQPWAGMGMLGGTTGESGKADNQVSTATVVFWAEAYGLHPEGLHARTRYV